MLCSIFLFILFINPENIRGQNSMRRERIGAGNEALVSKGRVKTHSEYSVAPWLPVTYVLVMRDEVIYRVTLQ